MIVPACRPSLLSMTMCPHPHAASGHLYCLNRDSNRFHLNKIYALQYTKPSFSRTRCNFIAEFVLCHKMLSVCLRHECIVTKWLNLGSRWFRKSSSVPQLSVWCVLTIWNWKDSSNGSVKVEWDDDITITRVTGSFCFYWKLTECPTVLPDKFLLLNLKDPSDIFLA